jgi:hypothetical protein
MFEKLNGTGVKLGPFELLAARFWPHDISLRHLWRKARADYPILAKYAIDPYYILQIISPVTSSPPLCTLKNVLHTEVSTIEAWRTAAVESLAKGLEILRNDCGVVAPKWFPYKTVRTRQAGSMILGRFLSGIRRCCGRRSNGSPDSRTPPRGPWTMRDPHSASGREVRGPRCPLPMRVSWASWPIHACSLASKAIWHGSLIARDICGRPWTLGSVRWLRTSSMIAWRTAM